MEINPQPDYLLRILIVEDNQYDYQLILHALSAGNINYVSELADDTVSFKKILENFNPHIILSDYNLPGFGGMQAFQLLRSVGKDIPFILVTGSLTEQLAIDCMKYGIDDFILKSSYKRLPVAMLNAIEKNKVEREKYTVTEELKKSQEELRLLLMLNQKSIEDERKRIAFEIHDQLGQQLTGLKMDAGWIKRKANDKKVEAKVDDMIELINETIKTTRTIASELCPPVLNDMGLIAALEYQCKDMEKRTDIKCDFNAGNDIPKLNEDVEINVFRIYQEALTNIMRHSGALNVKSNVNHQNKNLVITLTDDGRGFDTSGAKNNTMGLAGMRERALTIGARLELRSIINQGTKLELRIPLKLTHLSLTYLHEKE